MVCGRRGLLWFFVNGLSSLVVVFFKEFVFVFAQVGSVDNLVEVLGAFLYLAVFLGSCPLVSEVACSPVGSINHRCRFK